MYVSTQVKELGAFRIRNLWLWNPEYSSRNPESHKRSESRIQFSLTKTGIHGVESRIQDCLEFPYKGAKRASDIGANR